MDIILNCGWSKDSNAPNLFVDPFTHPGQLVFIGVHGRQLVSRLRTSVMLGRQETQGREIPAASSRIDRHLWQIDPSMFDPVLFTEPQVTAKIVLSFHLPAGHPHGHRSFYLGCRRGQWGMVWDGSPPSRVMLDIGWGAAKALGRPTSWSRLLSDDER